MGSAALFGGQSDLYPRLNLDVHVPTFEMAIDGLKRSVKTIKGIPQQADEFFGRQPYQRCYFCDMISPERQ